MCQDPNLNKKRFILGLDNIETYAIINNTIRNRTYPPVVIN